jgi:hypothetical protein
VHDEAGDGAARVAGCEEEDLPSSQLAVTARLDLDLVAGEEVRRHARPRDGDAGGRGRGEEIGEVRRGGGDARSGGAPAHEKVSPVHPSPAFDFVSGGSNAHVFATASMRRSRMIAGGS